MFYDNLKNKYIVLSLFLLGHLATYAQSVQRAESFTLNLPLAVKSDYEAKTQIKLEPGFSFLSNGNETLSAKINSSLSTADYNAQGINGDLAGGKTNGFQISTGYTVPPGTLPGNIDVSANGAATYTIPLNIPTGINNMTPQLSINYNSSAGMGNMGYKWSLVATSAISRATGSYYYDHVDGTTFVSSSIDAIYSDDGCFLLDGQRLLKNTAGYYYKEKYDQMKIEKIGSGSTMYFKATSLDGTVYTYNTIHQPDNTTSGLNWYLSSAVDILGNKIEYIYNSDDIQPVLTTINYTLNANAGKTQGDFVISFTYAKSRDVDKYFAGKLISKNIKYISKVEIKKSGNLLRSYEFEYIDNKGEKLSKINLKENGTLACSPTIINWESESNSFGASNYDFGDNSWGSSIFGDFDGDGKMDVFKVIQHTDILSNGDSIKYNNYFKILWGDGSISPEIDFPAENKAALNCTFADPVYTQEEVQELNRKYLKIRKYNYSGIPYSGYVSLPYYLDDFNNDGKIEMACITKEKLTDATVYSYGVKFYAIDKAGMKLNQINVNYNCAIVKDEISDIKNFMTTADVNGDGKRELIVIGINNIYIFTSDGGSYTVARNIADPYYLGSLRSSNSTSESLIIGDNNFVNRIKLEFTYANNTTITETDEKFNFGNPVMTADYLDYNLKRKIASIYLHPFIQTGDFNGDGNTDVLVWGTNTVDNNGQWYLLQNNGDKLVKKTITTQPGNPYSTLYRGSLESFYFHRSENYLLSGDAYLKTQVDYSKFITKDNPDVGWSAGTIFPVVCSYDYRTLFENKFFSMDMNHDGTDELLQFTTTNDPLDGTGSSDVLVGDIFKGVTDGCNSRVLLSKFEIKTKYKIYSFDNTDLNVTESADGASIKCKFYYPEEYDALNTLQVYNNMLTSLVQPNNVIFTFEVNNTDYLPLYLLYDTRDIETPVLGDIDNYGDLEFWSSNLYRYAIYDENHYSSRIDKVFDIGSTILVHNHVFANFVTSIQNGNNVNISLAYENSGLNYVPASNPYPTENNIFVGFLPMIRLKNYMTTYQGISGSYKTSISYGAPYLHLNKGFLCFSDVTQETTYGTTSISKNKISNDLYINGGLFYVPYAKKTEKYSFGNLISTIDYTITYVSANTNPIQINLAYTPSKDETLETDKLTNLCIKTTVNANNYGQVTDKKTDDLHGNTKLVEYSDFASNGEATKIITTTTSSGSASSFITTVTKDINNATGLPNSITDQYNNKTEYLSYDGFGNLLTERRTKIKDYQPVIEYTYKDNRLLASKKTTINSIVATELYEYDDNDQPIRKVDKNGLISANQYDVYGVLTVALSPNGRRKITNYGWVNISDKPEIQTYTKTTDDLGNMNTSYFDALGREVYKEMQPASGIKVTSYSIYNKFGQLTSVNSSVDGITNYSYQADGRIATSNIKGRQTTCTYSGATTYTTFNGVTKSVTLNAFGQKTSVSDAGGTLNYTYHPCGNVSSVSLNGFTVSSIAYNSKGLKESLTDPNAGTTNYTYNDLGMLLTQSDAKVNVTNMIYDDFGRLTSKTIANTSLHKSFSVTHNYSNDVYGWLNYDESTDENGQIVRNAYTYDKFGNILTNIQTINGANPRTFSYQYDVDNRLIKNIYPDGFTTAIAYEGNYIKSISDISTGINIFSCNASDYNARGQLTRYTQGNGCDITRTFDNNGLPSSFSFGQTGDIVTYSYSFDNLTFDLMSRSRSVNNQPAPNNYQYESFLYDKADRLIQWDFADNSIGQKINYAANGNILQKTDMGYYNYPPLKPNEVNSVIRLCGNTVSTDANNITYNLFGKINYMDWASAAKTYTIAYGPDGQRCTSTITGVGVNINGTTRYFGSYEERPVGDILHYVNSPDGLCSILRTNINKSSIRDMYYIATDYQGSIVGIINLSKIRVQEYSYDAWGRRRKADDWSNYNPTLDVLGFNSTVLITRGYTGHEHIGNGLDLVNMNGRVYDPRLGRFLSPDNEVSDAANSQAYNRYSYCLNNPLKYTDPDGNNPFFVLLFIIGIDQALWHATDAGIAAAENGGSFWDGALRSLAISIASMCVGYVVGSIVSSFVPSVILMNSEDEAFAWGVGSGALSGGISGGIVSAALGGSFKTGFINGAIIGGISGGLQKVDEYESEMGLFVQGCAQLGVKQDEAVPATDDFLSKSQKTWFEDAPMDKLKEFSVEHVPDNTFKSNSEGAVTEPYGLNGKLTGFSSVYFNKNSAFTSAKTLFYDMGHEFVHVSQISVLKGLSINMFKEHFKVGDEDVRFKDLMEFHAYQYNEALGNHSVVTFFTPEIVKALAIRYPSYFQKLSYTNFNWTSNVNYP